MQNLANKLYAYTDAIREIKKIIYLARVYKMTRFLVQAEGIHKEILALGKERNPSGWSKKLKRIREHFRYAVITLLPEENRYNDMIKYINNSSNTSSIISVITTLIYAKTFRERCRNFIISTEMFIDFMDYSWGTTNATGYGNPILLPVGELAETLIMKSLVPGHLMHCRHDSMWDSYATKMMHYSMPYYLTDVSVIYAYAKEHARKIETCMWGNALEDIDLAKLSEYQKVGSAIEPSKASGARFYEKALTHADYNMIGGLSANRQIISYDRNSNATANFWALNPWHLDIPKYKFYSITPPIAWYRKIAKHLAVYVDTIGVVLYGAFPVHLVLSEHPSVTLISVSTEKGRKLNAGETTRLLKAVDKNNYEFFVLHMRGTTEGNKIISLLQEKLVQILPLHPWVRDLWNRSLAPYGKSLDKEE